MSRAVYVAPLQALATERLADWATRFGEGLGARVLELTGDPATDTRLLVEVWCFACCNHARVAAQMLSHVGACAIKHPSADTCALQAKCVKSCSLCMAVIW